MNMFTRTLLCSSLLVCGASAFAQNMSEASMMSGGTTMVGGATMYPQKNIVENAVNSKDHTTLVAAVKAAGLVDTLQGKGPSPSLRQPMKRLPPYLLARWIHC